MVRPPQLYQISRQTHEAGCRPSPGQLPRRRPHFLSSSARNTIVPGVARGRPLPPVDSIPNWAHWPARLPHRLDQTVKPPPLCFACSTQPGRELQEQAATPKPEITPAREPVPLLGRAKLALLCDKHQNGSSPGAGRVNEPGCSSPPPSGAQQAGPKPRPCQWGPPPGAHRLGAGRGGQSLPMRRTLGPWTQQKPAWVALDGAFANTGWIGSRPATDLNNRSKAATTARREQGAPLRGT